MLALGSMALIGTYTVFVRAPQCLRTFAALAAAAETQDQDMRASVGHLGDLKSLKATSNGIDYFMAASDEGIFLGIPEEGGGWRCVDVNRVASRMRIPERKS